MVWDETDETWLLVQSTCPSSPRPHLHMRQEEGASTLFLVGPCPARVPTYHQSLQTGCLPFSESGSIQFLLPWPLRSSSTEVGHSTLPQTKKTYNWEVRTAHTLELSLLKIIPHTRLEPRAPDTRERVKRPPFCILSALGKYEPQALPLQILNHLCSGTRSRVWVRADMFWVLLMRASIWAQL